MKAQIIERVEFFSEAELESLEFVPEELEAIEAERVPDLDNISFEDIAKDLEAYFEGDVEEVGLEARSRSRSPGRTGSRSRSPQGPGRTSSRSRSRSPQGPVCWVCYENVNLDRNTCWPVETNPAPQSVDNQFLYQNHPTHLHCMRRVIRMRGPGGNTIMGYAQGSRMPRGGLIKKR